MIIIGVRSLSYPVAGQNEGVTGWGMGAWRDSLPEDEDPINTVHSTQAKAAGRALGGHL